MPGHGSLALFAKMDVGTLTGPGALAIAALSGAASFLSPCVAPLLPESAVKPLQKRLAETVRQGLRPTGT